MSDGVCTCPGRPGFMLDESMPVEWWVCSECGKPTRMYLENAFQQALQEQ